MFTKYDFLKLILLLFIANSTVMQSQTSGDLGLWNSAELGYEFNDNWKGYAEGQFRLKENLNTVDEYFGELGIKRKIFKGFRLGAAFRFIRENDTRGAIQGYEDHVRFHFQATYKHKVGDFRLGYRIRFQNKKELGLADGIDNFNVQRLRFKSSLEYKIKNWPLDPKIWGELFRRYERGTQSEFDKYRITIGTEYNMKNAGSIAGFWRLENDLDQRIGDGLYIIGLAYSYTIKN